MTIDEIKIETRQGTINGRQAITHMLGVLADARHEAGKIDHDAGHNGWEGLEIPDDIDGQIDLLTRTIKELASYERVFHWLDDMYEAKLCRPNLAAARKVLKALKDEKKVAA